MKPSISVIAAERRFFASAENASSGKRSPIPLPIAFLRLSGSLCNAHLLVHPARPALAPSYAKRRDVDSLLGSNFYGDASPNISGKPRLLALVFDERTSRSILSGETSFSTSFLLPPYS